MGDEVMWIKSREHKKIVLWRHKEKSQIGVFFKFYNHNKFL